MPDTDRTSTAITGAAGAYFVVAELSQLGWAASPTWGNAPRTDVLAQKQDGSRMAAIQVKTRRSGSIHLGMGGEKAAPSRANEWYVLVALHGHGNRPDFYVVPRNHIAALVYCGYREWLNSPGRGGGQRRATTMRTIEIDEVSPYLERGICSTTTRTLRRG